MSWQQWLVTGMGCVISGVTVWISAFGLMPDDLGQVFTGAVLAIACFVWAFVGLERTGNETE